MTLLENHLIFGSICSLQMVHATHSPSGRAISHFRSVISWCTCITSTAVPGGHFLPAGGGNQDDRPEAGLHLLPGLHQERLLHHLSPRQEGCVQLMCMRRVFFCRLLHLSRGALRTCFCVCVCVFGVMRKNWAILMFESFASSAFSFL